jgi:serine protease
VTYSRAALAAAAALATAAGTLVLATGAGAAPPPEDPGRGRANDSAVEQGQTYDRFIVQFDPTTRAASDDGAARAEIEQVGSSSGHKLSLTRRLSTAGALLEVDAALDADKARKLMAKFAERTGVDFVEPDVRMYATSTPNDTSYPQQWHYSNPLAGMNLPAAWDTADGTGVTVAVVDTGITSHSDLAANVLPGYDFITSATAARDGNGRDADAADLGDWYTAGECGQPAGSNSSWHGTHVSGTIAAVTNNAAGVSGVAYGAKIVPVRVLGKCGGTLADIADAITWASGGTVTGVPANANPAKVINMSLGGSGACGATYQNAINGAVSRGTTVVVAAGNSNADAAAYQPASCTSTVVVAAGDFEGNRASYSNYGAIVDLTAPGGETNVAGHGVLSTLNTGTTSPAAEGYAWYQGTSMATPHVAGLAALVLGERAMTPAQVESALKSGTRPLPGTCTGGCGAGLADAAKTIGALAPAPSATPSPSASVTPSASPAPSPTSASSTPPPALNVFTNGTDVAIPDRSSVDSLISVTGRTGNAPSTLKVDVTVRHTFRGDLQVDLVAPDGSLYRLKSASASDSADDVVGTYTVNASTEVANGTWRLRVADRYSGDTGYIDSWGLTF